MKGSFMGFRFRELRLNSLGNKEDSTIRSVLCGPAQQPPGVVGVHNLEKLPSGAIPDQTDFFGVRAPALEDDFEVGAVGPVGDLENLIDGVVGGGG